MKPKESVKVSSKIANNVTEKPEPGQHLAEIMNDDVSTWIKVNGVWNEIVSSEDATSEATNSLHLVNAKICAGKQTGVPIKLAVPDSLLQKIVSGLYVTFNTSAKGFSEVSATPVPKKQAESLIAGVIE